MKKFIKRTILFTFPLIIFIVMFESLLRNIPNDYSYKRNYLDKHSNEMETIFFGSSHSYRSINPELIQSKSFNVSYVSQSLDYDFNILKKYKNKTSKLKFIVLPIDYFSLFNRLDTGVESWRIKNYAIYYGFDLGYDFKDNFELLNGKLVDNFKRLIHFYVNHKSEVSCNTLGYGAKHSSKKNKDLINSGKEAAKRHAEKSKTYFKENIALVNEIIAIAKSKNVKVILYTNPAYKTYTSELNQEQLQKTYTTIKSIASSNSNVRYYDFLTDPSFVKEDFFDADHLNEIGAEKFSKKMDNIIISLK